MIPQILPSASGRLRRLLPHLPGLVCDLLTVWLLLAGQNASALFSMFAALAAHYQAYVRAVPPAPAVSAEPRADAEELLRRLGRVVGALERALEQAKAEITRQPLTASEHPVLNEDLWSVIQTLYEAAYTRDGEYALKAIPSLDAALAAQGVSVVACTPETQGYFDLFPTDGAGVTIRPAMLKDGKLAARGEATVRETP